METILLIVISIVGGISFANLILTIGFMVVNFVIKIAQGQAVAPTVVVATTGAPGTVSPSAVIKK